MTDSNEILKKISKVITKFDEKEMLLFLKAFLTPKEIDDLANRFLLVGELLEGKTQREISEHLGISISQITRGSTELKYGSGKEIFKKCFE